MHWEPSTTAGLETHTPLLNSMDGRTFSARAFCCRSPPRQATASAHPVCGNGARSEPVRHRQTKGAETDMFGLPLPRRTSTLPNLGFDNDDGNDGSRRVSPVAVRPGEGPFSIAADVKRRPNDFSIAAGVKRRPNDFMLSP